MLIESKDVPKPVPAKVAADRFPLPELKKPSRFSSFAGLQTFMGRKS